ncbi:MAG: hypothetical protein R2698_08235 [Microthrixaceae bacterium]
MLRLDLATVLLQWAVGGLLFLWVTTRAREVGIGYGWLLRAVFGVMAVLAAVAGFRYHRVWVRDLSAIAVAVGVLPALAVSWTRRRAGVRRQREQVQRRSDRIAEMTGIDREVQRFDDTAPEFPPALDLVAPVLGLPGLVAAGIAAGSPAWVQVLRVLVGAAFLGCVTDGMLLGHWYLTQPGLPRRPLLEQVRWLTWIWPLEVAVMLLPTGMVSVLTGGISDGWGGMLGWFWVACAVTTIVLTRVTRAALREREYSAVMAATGLLYLAILTGFGQDLVARLVLNG